MKTILVLFLIGFVASASGQGFQLTGYAGYTIPAYLKGDFGKYSLEASPNYGVFGSFILPRVKGFPGSVNIEMQYNLQSSELNHQKKSPDSLVQLGGASMHSFLAGATMDFSRKQIKPFAGMMVGFTCLYPDAYTHMTRFTFSLLGGTRIALSQSMGLRLQGQIFFPTVYKDPDVGLEPMVAARTGVSPNAVVVCANFTGGIYYQFKSKNRELKK